MARYTAGQLLEHPTWLTEWSLHMTMPAAADYEATGDAVLALRHYKAGRPESIGAWDLHSPRQSMGV